jgi:Ca-activated chloride channel family protein
LHRSHAAPALIHPQAALLGQLAAEFGAQRQRPPWLWLLGCGLLLLALSRPLLTFDESRGRNFLLAIDVSGSMRALDYAINNQALSRLDLLKRVVDDFLSTRSHDRAGLLVFGDDAYTLAPLTSDIELVRRLLGEVKNGMAGERTALGQAIALGVQRLLHEDSRSRIMILLTDGANSAGDIHPEEALLMARHAGVRIYTIGLGREGKVLFPRGPMEKPELAEVPLDEVMLQKLAQDSGGRYYHASASGELPHIIADIEQLETIPLDINRDKSSDLFWVPLIAGMLLLLVAWQRGNREVMP